MAQDEIAVPVATGVAYRVPIEVVHLPTAHPDAPGVRLAVMVRGGSLTMWMKLAEGKASKMGSA